MASPSDRPGWRPDPEQPGTVRWWNGLGWSDARRSADETVDRVRAAEDAVRGSTITPQQVAATTADRRTVRGAPAAAAPRSAAAANPFASTAMGAGIAGYGFGLDGLLPLVGVLLSLGGLVRARRLARDRVRRTGLGQSLAGLVISVIGLLHWAPALVELVRDVSTR